MKRLRVRRPAGWIVGAAATAAALTLAHGAARPPPLTLDTGTPGSERGPRDPAQLLVLGDTQRTTLVERLRGHEQNEDQRRSLMRRLAHEERAATLVHLGDLVSQGDSSDEWDYFDRLMSPLVAQGVRILPVLGNHDYWGLDRVALQLARRRFPELQRRTYRVEVERGLALVLLDSNLADAEAAEQARWFEAALAGFERDRRVRGVLVFTHHPPYTNGEGRSGDRGVNELLLPPFFRADKTLALLSGHVHGYERFELFGKTFVVSGGGGGPRVRYVAGDDGPLPPAYRTPDGAPRAFHYVRIEDEITFLRFCVECVERDAACPEGRLETFELALPGAATSAAASAAPSEPEQRE